MILVIDNYDSFTYNLVQYIGSLGVDVVVKRNDKIDLAGIEDLHPERIVISPGPGYPNEAGISIQVIQHFKDKCPILGVCLGHQAIGEAFGGDIIPAGEIVHGKDYDVQHDGQTIFADLPETIKVGRYHSLVVAADTVPACLTVSAKTQDGLIMGLRHKEFPVEGVQFHPESILTPKGIKIIENFLKL